MDLRNLNVQIQYLIVLNLKISTENFQSQIESFITDTNESNYTYINIFLDLLIDMIVNYKDVKNCRTIQGPSV